jgi:hypothetical protein
MVYAFSISTLRASCSAHLPLLDSIALALLYEKQELRSSSQTIWKVCGNITLEQAGIKLGALTTTTVCVSTYRVIQKSLFICKTTNIFLTVNLRLQVTTRRSRLYNQVTHTSRTPPWASVFTGVLESLLTLVFTGAQELLNHSIHSEFTLLLPVF